MSFFGATGTPVLDFWWRFVVTLCWRWRTELWGLAVAGDNLEVKLCDRNGGTEVQNNGRVLNDYK